MFLEFQIITYDKEKKEKLEDLGISPSDNDADEKLRNVTININDILAFHGSQLTFLGNDVEATCVISEHFSYTLLISYKKFKSIFTKYRPEKVIINPIT